MENIKIAIIGSGIFGAEIALTLSELDIDVDIYDLNHDFLQGASKNNQNRLHLGFHYPRDFETAKQSILGFQRFKEKYSDCIENNFLNTYFISEQNSKVSYTEYIDFCNKLNLPYKKVDIDKLPIKILNTLGGIQCDEVVYDCNLLKENIKKRILKKKNIKTKFNCEVKNIITEGDKLYIYTKKNQTKSYDYVINTTYGCSNFTDSNIDKINFKRQYEYTVVPIIKLDIPKIGITIMDGPFMSLLPYGKSNLFLLYHVDNSVISRDYDLNLNRKWLSKSTSPFYDFNKQRFNLNFINKCKVFLPEITQSEVIDYLEGPRMVKMDCDFTDERRSNISHYGNYIEVFSGKVDHAVWVAEDIKKIFIKNL